MLTPTRNGRFLIGVDVATDRSKKRILKDDSVSSSKEEKPRSVSKSSEKKLSGQRVGLKKVFKPFAWVGRHLIPRYLINSWKELRLVSWPNRKETRQLTTAVVLFAIAIGFMVAVVDYGLDKLFRKVILKQ